MIIEKLYRMTEKNFKILWRSRSSVIIVLLVPVLAMILLGMAYNNLEPYGLKIGVYIEEDNEITNSIIKAMDEKFSIIKFEETENCINSILDGQTQVCAVLNRIMIEENKENKITFYVDYSKVNLVWMIIDTTSQAITEKSEEISFDLTKILLDQLTEAKDSMQQSQLLIETIKSRNEELIGKADNIYTDIYKLRPETSIEKEELIELENKLSDMTESMGSVQEYVELAIEEYNELESFVNTLPLSGNQSQEMDKLMDELEEGLEELKQEVNSDSNSTLEEADRLTARIQGKLEEIQARFEEVKVAQKNTLTNLEQMKETISKAQEKIKELQKNIEEVSSDISSIKIKNATSIIKPIETVIEPVVPEKTFLNYIFPTLLAIVIMFTAIMFTSTAIISEKNSKAFFRNTITPTEEWEFMAARYITDILIIGIQISLFLLISILVLKVKIAEETFLLGTAAVMVISMFICIGMIMGYILNSQQVGVLAAIALSSIMLFLSNTILPIESMTEPIRAIAKYNPFMIAEGMLRKIAVYSLGIEQVLGEAYLIIGYSAIILFATYIVNKLINEK